jgi:ComF family protein
MLNPWSDRGPSRVSVPRALRAAADALLAVLLAPGCVSCSQLLEHPTRGPVCRHCWQSILPLTAPLCDACGDPLPTWRTFDLAGARCARCRRAARYVDRARAAGAYDGALRSIIHALKYGGRRSLAGPLAALMVARGAEILTGADAVVPVPLHPSRRRERGFNQADDLARCLCLPGLPILRALRRLRATSTQADLPASRRHANVRGAFSLTRDARDLRGKTIVLIDDVSTTGATLAACGRVLKDGGILEVRALTAARVVTTPH